MPFYQPAAGRVSLGYDFYNAKYFYTERISLGKITFFVRQRYDMRWAGLPAEAESAGKLRSF
jgi:hypothetical protein